MRRDGLPGVSVAVVTDDGLAYVEGFGARDLAGNRPATPDTLYGVGGVTESFTALAVAQLSEAGMLSIDNPLAEYLDLDLGDGRFDEPIRIRHLLTHTSGLPSLGTDEALLGRRLRRETDTLALSSDADVRAYVEGAAAERAAPPGERVARCTAGYVLLGRVIEACTGRSFATYVDEHVFDPLGMDRATFDDAAFAMDDDHMTPYLHEDGDLVAASFPTSEATAAGGGAIASVRHLADYLRMHLNEGRFAGRDVVGAAAARDLRDPAADAPAGSYARGFQIRETCGYDLIGRSGSVAVSSAYAGFSPDAGTGVAVAANSSPDYPLAHLGQGVFAAALGEDPTEAVPFFERRRRFDRLTGEYASYHGIERALVARDGGTLRVETGNALGGGGTPLVPGDGDDPYAFRAVAADGTREPATFRVDDGGVDLLYGRWRFHKVDDASPDRTGR